MSLNPLSLIAQNSYLVAKSKSHKAGNVVIVETNVPHQWLAVSDRPVSVQELAASQACKRTVKESDKENISEENSFEILDAGVSILLVRDQSLNELRALKKSDSALYRSKLLECRAELEEKIFQKAREIEKQNMLYNDTINRLEQITLESKVAMIESLQGSSIDVQVLTTNEVNEQDRDVVSSTKHIEKQTLRDVCMVNKKYLPKRDRREGSKEPKRAPTDALKSLTIDEINRKLLANLAEKAREVISTVQSPFLVPLALDPKNLEILAEYYLAIFPEHRSVAQVIRTVPVAIILKELGSRFDILEKGIEFNPSSGGILSRARDLFTRRFVRLALKSSTKTDVKLSKKGIAILAKAVRVSSINRRKISRLPRYNTIERAPFEKTA